VSRSAYTSFELTGDEPLAPLHIYPSVPAADEPLSPCDPVRFLTRRRFINADDAYGFEVGVPAYGEI